MLLTVMRHIANFFTIDDGEYGEFEIADGVLRGLQYPPIAGQYFLITGSLLNDGVYLCEDDAITLPDAKNEVWEGVIYLLRIPRDFLRLVDEIQAFVDSPSGQASNITSARFGIQSYTWATDRDGNRTGWEAAFRQRLSQFRRYTPDIEM